MDHNIFQQFVFDNKAIMAVTEFQKAFPLPIGAQNPSNSLSSLLPYANMLSFMSGFDTTNLLGNLQLLQTAANMMATIEQQQLQTQRQVLPTFGGPSSAATCASSVIAPSESPNEANNNFVKQQFSSPSSSPPFNLDESLQNSICKSNWFNINLNFLFQLKTNLDVVTIQDDLLPWLTEKESWIYTRKATRSAISDDY